MGVRQIASKYPKHDLKDRRKELREKATPSEKRLWRLLKGQNTLGMKFRRQHQIGPYIVDFYCAVSKVVVELDGIQHSTFQGAKLDAERDAFLSKLGVKVIRFPNTAVAEMIVQALEKSLSPQP